LWITFYYQSKRHRKSLNLDDTKANRKLAENVIIPEIQYKLNLGTFFEKEKSDIPTVEEYAKISFELHSYHRKASTLSDYESSLKLHINPYFADKRIDRIKPSDVALWQNMLLDKLSPRRVRTIRAVFNMFFQDALRDGIIDKNPLTMVKVPKIEKVEVKPFTLDEMMKIIQSGESDIQSFVALGFLTGMRSGEMIGLRWEDIDFKKGVINVLNKPGFKTKTRKWRPVPLHKDLRRILWSYRNGSENCFDTTNWRRILNRIMEKAKLNDQGIAWHTFRHTFASHLVMNGAPLATIAELLGHSSITTTMIYSHLSADHVKDAVDKLKF